MRKIAVCITVVCTIGWGIATLLGTATAQETQVNQTVLLNNHGHVVPLRELENRDIAHIGRLDRTDLGDFGGMLERYAPVAHFELASGSEGYLRLDEELKYYNTLVFALTAADLSDPRLLQFIKTQAVGKQVILAVFGDGNGLHALNFEQFPILWAPAINPVSAKNAAMSIFGGIACTGRLPQSFSPRFTKGAGFTTAQTRLEYADAAVFGID